MTYIKCFWAPYIIDFDDVAVLVMKGKKSNIIFNNKISTSAINEIDPSKYPLIFYLLTHLPSPIFLSFFWFCFLFFVFFFSLKPQNTQTSRQPNKNPDKQRGRELPERKGKEREYLPEGRERDSLEGRGDREKKKKRKRKSHRGRRTPPLCARSMHPPSAGRWPSKNW